MTPNVLQSDNLTVDLDTRKVFVDNQEVGVSDKEFNLLVTLMQNKGQVLNMHWLLENIFGGGEMHMLNIHIKWLREKIEHDINVRRIASVRGVGYRFDG